MDVTATAVRQQLMVLLAEGFIEQRSENIGRGRPKHVYTLTAKGRALFPHHYDEFTNSLLREILLAEGPGKVVELLAHGQTHGGAICAADCLIGATNARWR